MSLKSFHIVFIAAAILTSFGFAAWCFREGGGTIAMGGFSTLLGIGLLFYARWFLKHRLNGENHAP